MLIYLFVYLFRTWITMQNTVRTAAERRALGESWERTRRFASRALGRFCIHLVFPWVTNFKHVLYEDKGECMKIGHVEIFLLTASIYSLVHFLTSIL